MKLSSQFSFNFVYIYLYIGSRIFHHRTVHHKKKNLTNLRNQKKFLRQTVPQRKIRARYISFVNQINETKLIIYLCHETHGGQTILNAEERGGVNGHVLYLPVP